MKNRRKKSFRAVKFMLFVFCYIFWVRACLVINVAYMSADLWSSNVCFMFFFFCCCCFYLLHRVNSGKMGCLSLITLCSVCLQFQSIKMF